MVRCRKPAHKKTGRSSRRIESLPDRARDIDHSRGLHLAPALAILIVLLVIVIHATACASPISGSLSLNKSRMRSPWLFKSLIPDP
jgi:hypothetical protein